MNIFELLKRMIAIESISGNEESVATFIADYLDEVGFDVELNYAEERRPNVYAKVGEPEVIMSSHIDTVPPYIEFREDDQFIYGRGSCDAKGVIAAMMKAAEDLKQAGVSDFGLLFLVGEEAGSIGAKVANKIPNRCRYNINGEPTESKLVLGSKGALKVGMHAKGKAAHSAYPQLGESATNKLLDVLQELRQAKLPEDPVLGPANMNIGLISGGVAANVISPMADAELMFRVVTSTKDLKDILESTTAGRASIEYLFECEPVFMERLEGFDTGVVAFTTDIPMLTNWGKPLLFGPGSIHDAHTANENIGKQELSQAVDSYQSMVTRLKGQNL